MNLNNDQYFTQQEKLWYAMTQVSDKVKNQVLLYCLNNTVNLSDLTAFKKLMWTSFEDSDRQGTAETTIHELCQRNQEFSTYLAEFNCHISYTDWNEAARKAALLAGISTELHGYLISMDVTNMSLNTLTQTLQNIDSCHWAAQQLNPHAWVITSQLWAFTIPTITPSVMRLWGATFNTFSSPFTATTQAAVPAHITDVTVNEDSMNLSAVQSRPRRPLSLTEKSRHMQQNLCLYCDRERHKALTCWVKPPVQLQLQQTSFSQQQLKRVKESKNE